MGGGASKKEGDEKKEGEDNQQNENEGDKSPQSKQSGENQEQNQNQDGQQSQQKSPNQEDAGMFNWDTNKVQGDNRKAMQGQTGYKMDIQKDQEEKDYKKKREQYNTQQQNNKQFQQTQRSNFSNEFPDRRKQDESFQMSEELSPIVKEDTPQEKEQKIKQKISEAQRNKISQSSFQWPQQGSCKVTMVGFQIEYNLQLLNMRLMQSYDHYTVSKLQWKYNSSRSVFDFILQDEEVYDLKTNTSEKLPYNIIHFMVDQNGNYIGISEESEFMKKHKILKKQIREKKIMDSDAATSLVSRKLNNRRKRKKKKNNQDLIIQKTEEKMKKLWTLAVTNWVDSSKFEITGKFERNNKNLIHAKIHEEKSKDELEDFLKIQLEDPRFYKACFQSKKTFRDRLRLWNIEDGQAEIELPEYIREQKKTIKFPLLEKLDSSQAQLEEDSGKPHTIMTNTSKKLVIQNENKDSFVDVNNELKLYNFQWDDSTEAENEQVFLAELSKFKDICDHALKKMIAQLSRVGNLPLQHRAKVKSKYFELE